MLIPLRDADRRESGPKTAALGDLLRAGLPVPPGFVIPFDVYRRTVGGLPAGTVPRELPRELIDAISRSLATLGDAPVAVRSSADDEDGVRSSRAGQHDTVLGVRDLADVASAVLTCWRSLHSPRAVASRADPPNSRDAAMAVLVQTLVDADVSGVLFTPHDASGSTRVEASWGLGPSVVGGTVDPDSIRIDPEGRRTDTIADKRIRIDRVGARLVTSDVPDADRRRPTLTATELSELTRLGAAAAEVLGAPQDIEWAIAGGRVWLVQSRPITAALPATRSDEPRTSSIDLVGAPGSPGVAHGPTRVIRGPEDFGSVRHGDILICRSTDPSWTALLGVASGVVTEIGGVLSHAAIVAREFGIPAVLGVRDAMTLLHDKPSVAIDGTTGVVTPTERPHDT